MRYQKMARTKYVYSVFDLQKKLHIGFFSSLDRGLEFALAHELKIKAWDYKISAYCRYTDKHRAALRYKPNNEYDPFGSYENYTHVFIKIPLDENGQLKL